MTDSSPLKKRARLSDPLSAAERPFKCTILNCQYAAKAANTLKRHKAYVHNIDAKLYYCNIDACSRSFKQPFELRVHKMNAHNIGVTWHVCDHAGCTYKCKKAAHLRRHKNDVHKTDSDALIHCNVQNCTYTCSIQSNMSQHKANVHDLNAVWYKCDYPGCSHQVKLIGNLNVHKERVHDIGEHKCDFCSNNRNSSIELPYLGKINHVCRMCYNKATNAKSRVEHDMSAYLDTLDTLKQHLVASDRAFRSLGGCSNYRPDKFYIIDGNVVEDASGMPTFPNRLVLHVECDEHEHRWENGDYTCDERRISECYDEIDCAHYVVVRWNPHSYTRNNCTDGTVKRADRFVALGKLLEKLLTNPPQSPLYIYYMYYSYDNERLAKAIPHELCY